MLKIFYNKNLNYFLSLILIIASLFLVFKDFRGYGIQQDELKSIEQVLFNDYGVTADAPLYPFLLKLFTDFFQSYSTDSFRFFSILIALLLPLAVFIFMRRITTNRKAVIAVFLIIFSEFFFSHSINIRPYALFAAIYIWCFYVFLRSIESGKVSNLFFVSTLLLSVTHLLSVQILVSFAVASICIYIIKHWLKDGCQFSRESILQLCKLNAVLLASSFFGNIWAFERFSRFHHLAITPKMHNYGFLKFFVNFFPIGPTNFEVQIAISWIFLVLGLLYLYKKKKIIFITYVITFFIVILITWLTIGDRIYWNAHRYFVHLIVISLCIIAIGVDELYVMCKSKIKTRFAPQIVLLFLAILFIFIGKQSQTHVYLKHNRIKHQYNFSISNKASAFVITSSKRRDQLLQLEKNKNNDTRPVFSVINNKLYIAKIAKVPYTKVEYANISISDLPIGFYQSDIACNTLNVLVRDFEFLRFRLANSKLQGLFYCELIRIDN